MTVFELKPFRDRVAARRAKNPGNPTWALLAARWEALTGHARVTLDAYAKGRPAVSYERQTAELLLTLNDAVPGRDVVDVTLAIFALAEQRPARFKSDKGFDYQLARRCRGLADVSAGTRWNAKEARLKRIYRDVPPRVTECLAASLKLAFGIAGLRLAELEKQDAAGLHAERRMLHAALEEMK